jgi:hypothetical protein
MLRSADAGTNSHPKRVRWWPYSSQIPDIHVGRSDAGVSAPAFSSANNAAPSNRTMIHSNVAMGRTCLEIYELMMPIQLFMQRFIKISPGGG